MQRVASLQANEGNVAAVDTRLGLERALRMTRTQQQQGSKEATLGTPQKTQNNCMLAINQNCFTCISQQTDDRIT